jgi:hypothetical protein
MKLELNWHLLLIVATMAMAGCGNSSSGGSTGSAGGAATGGAQGSGGASGAGGTSATGGADSGGASGKDGSAAGSTGAAGSSVAVATPSFSWVGVIGSGQSLSVGTTPAALTTQPYNNLMLALNGDPGLHREHRSASDRQQHGMAARRAEPGRLRLHRAQVPIPGALRRRRYSSQRDRLRIAGNRWRRATSPATGAW